MLCKIQTWAFWCYYQIYTQPKINPTLSCHVSYFYLGMFVKQQFQNQKNLSNWSPKYVVVEWESHKI